MELLWIGIKQTELYVINNHWIIIHVNIICCIMSRLSSSQLKLEISKYE